VGGRNGFSPEVLLGGRAASGGALAPEPPPATRNTPEYIRNFPKTSFFFRFFDISLSFPKTSFFFHFCNISLCQCFDGRTNLKNTFSLSTFISFFYPLFLVYVIFSFTFSVLFLDPTDPHSQRSLCRTPPYGTAMVMWKPSRMRVANGHIK